MIGDQTQNEFNYKRWYNLSTAEELSQALKNGNAHWADAMGKTWLHPTVSIDSPYNGYINPYNPYGLTFGKRAFKNLPSFNGYNTMGKVDIYTPSTEQLNNSNLDKTLDILGYINDRIIENSSVGKDGENISTVGGLLPTLYVMPNENYIDLKPNHTNTGWIYKERK